MRSASGYATRSRSPSSLAITPELEMYTAAPKNTDPSQPSPSTSPTAMPIGS